MQPSPYGCPRCRIALVAIPVAGMTIHGCPHCSGAFLGSACARILLERLPHEAIATAWRADAGARVAVNTALAVGCPFCQRPMQRTRAAAAGVEVDTCAQHGTWYDRNEIVGIAEALRRTRWHAPAAAAAVGVGVAGVAGAAYAAHAYQPAAQQASSEVAWTVAEVGAEVGAEVVAEGGVEVAAGALGFIFSLLAD